MMKKTELSSFSACAGCAAKMGAAALGEILVGLQKQKDPRLLVGFDHSDDAAAYELCGEEVLVATTDFFPPPVADPYLYGQIAAANALSDIYAMGGEPRLALNILAVPESLSKETVRAIVAGGAERVRAAGALLAGGHTVFSDTPLYGLAVWGCVKKDSLWTNGGARPGDALILTKALGSGIITVAAQGELVAADVLKKVYGRMARLNKTARDVLQDHGVHACTDITGFGLLGHTLELARAGGCSVLLDASALPYQAEALDFARMGFIPAGAYRNRDFAASHVEAATIDRALADICYDPQTGGGLCCALPEKEAEACLHELHLHPETAEAALIGRVVERREKYIYLK